MGFRQGLYGGGIYYKYSCVLCVSVIIVAAARRRRRRRRRPKPSAHASRSPAPPRLPRISGTAAGATHTRVRARVAAEPLDDEDDAGDVD